MKWQSSRSYSFGVTNGTRQGSIFSPRGGFNTYLDPMLESLRNSGYGCTIGRHFYGGLAYADDVLIMGNTSLDPGGSHWQKPQADAAEEILEICKLHHEDQQAFLEVPAGNCGY